MPNVGETVGWSRRVDDDYDELIGASKGNKLDQTPHNWYTDQRKYGTCPHGGYGLGTARFVVWLLGEDHIRTVCLSLRYIDRRQLSSFSRK